MSNLVQFLQDNWKYISIGLVVLLEIILIIIKRKPKKYDEFADAVFFAISYIPEFIRRAEELNVDGPEKKARVFSWLLEMVSGYIKRDLTLSENDYCFSVFSSSIEAVLDCPTKKGGYGRENEK